LILKKTVIATYKEDITPFRYSNNYVKYKDTDEFLSYFHDTILARSESAIVQETVSWVRRNIEYSLYYFDEKQNMYFPDQIYKRKKGTCGDMATLCAAITKSFGIPTKLAYGYITEYKPEGEKRTYHAWIYAHIDGKWQMFDPVWSEAKISNHKIKSIVSYEQPLELF
jgi:transglutaminase-like putative cysteine protease